MKQLSPGAFPAASSTSGSGLLPHFQATPKPLATQRQPPAPRYKTDGYNDNNTDIIMSYTDNTTMRKVREMQWRIN